MSTTHNSAPTQEIYMRAETAEAYRLGRLAGLKMALKVCGERARINNEQAASTNMVRYADTGDTVKVAEVRQGEAEDCYRAIRALI